MDEEMQKRAHEFCASKGERVEVRGTGADGLQFGGRLK